MKKCKRMIALAMCMVMTVLSANTITFATEENTTKSSMTEEFFKEDGKHMYDLGNGTSKNVGTVLTRGYTGKITESDTIMTSLGGVKWEVASGVTNTSQDNNGPLAEVFLHSGDENVTAYYQYASAENGITAEPIEAEMYYTRSGENETGYQNPSWKKQFMDIIYGVSPVTSSEITNDGTVHTVKLYMVGFNIVKVDGKYQLGYRFWRRDVKETVGTDGKIKKGDIIRDEVATQRCKTIPDLSSATGEIEIVKLLKVKMNFDIDASGQLSPKFTINGKYTLDGIEKEYTVELGAAEMLEADKKVEEGTRKAVGIYADTQTVTTTAGAYAKPTVTYQCMKHTYDDVCDTKCNICGATRTIEHGLTLVSAKAPTSTEAGNIKYWKCETEGGCRKYFADEKGTQEITESDTVLPALNGKATAERTYKVSRLTESGALPVGIVQYTTSDTTTIYDDNNSTLKLGKKNQNSNDVNVFVTSEDSNVAVTSIEGKAQTGIATRAGLHFIYKSKEASGKTTYSAQSVTLYASSATDGGLKILFNPVEITVENQKVSASCSGSWNACKSINPETIVQTLKKSDGSELSSDEKTTAKFELSKLTTAESLSKATDERWIEYRVYKAENQANIQFVFKCGENEYLYEYSFGTINTGEKVTLGVGLTNLLFATGDSAQDIYLKDFTVGYEVSEEYAPQINGATFRKDTASEEGQTVAYQCTVPAIIEGKKIATKGMVVSVEAYIAKGLITKSDMVENVAADNEQHIRTAETAWKSGNKDGFVANVGGVKNENNGRKYIVRVYVKYEDGLVIYSNNSRNSQGIADGYATNSVISIAKYYLKFCWKYYKNYDELKGITDVIENIAEDGQFTYKTDYSPKNDNGKKIVYNWFSENADKISSVLKSVSSGIN